MRKFFSLVWLLAAFTVLGSDRPPKPVSEAKMPNVKVTGFLMFESKLRFLMSDRVILDMCKIPAGSFQMGSPADELGRSRNEVPHQVAITRDFYLGIYEVTQAQWQFVMGNNPSKNKGPNLPVEKVSWNDAKMFCRRLNELYAYKLPREYRFDLPTEAQWEYACRAGTTTALYSGRNLTSKVANCKNLDELGWYKSNSDNKTHPVGKKKPNAWCLYDMYGNVWEWCLDWYAPYSSKTGAFDPTGPKNGKVKILRGGAFCSEAFYNRSASRMTRRADDKFSYLGFRLALVNVENNPKSESKPNEEKFTDDAVNIYLELAKRGDIAAQFNLAECYNKGKGGVAKDPSAAFMWYSKAAEQGHFDAQVWLARYYDRKKNYAEAFKWLSKVAEFGNKDIKNQMANYYFRGHGVKKNNARGWKWVRKAAEAGSPLAMRNLASHNLHIKNFVEAEKWLRRAAETGNSRSQYFMGNFYYKGQGGKTDYAEAVKWYRKAADKKNTDALAMLGELYLKGHGVKQDYAEAAKWYRKAAEQKHSHAQAMLGELYLKGLGVKQDKDEAVKWYRKAAEQGNADAKNMLKKLNN